MQRIHFWLMRYHAWALKRHANHVTEEMLLSIEGIEKWED